MRKSSQPCSQPTTDSLMSLLQVMELEANADDAAPMHGTKALLQGECVVIKTSRKLSMELRALKHDAQKDSLTWETARNEECCWMGCPENLEEHGARRMATCWIDLTGLSLHYCLYGNLSFKTLWDSVSNSLIVPAQWLKGHVVPVILGLQRGPSALIISVYWNK